LPGGSAITADRGDLPAVHLMRPARETPEAVIRVAPRRSAELLDSDPIVVRGRARWDESSRRGETEGTV
jgi:hypothetical protein